jgi:hypothetical protein
MQLRGRSPLTPPSPLWGEGGANGVIVALAGLAKIDEAPAGQRANG